MTFSLLALSAGCEDKTPKMTRNPPPTDTGQPPPSGGSLPAWDDVKSGHPEGATNPPIPSLFVTRDGDCYKKWAPPFARPSGDQVVEACTPAQCGVRIQCPPRAQALLAAAKASAATSASAAPSASAPGPAKK